VNSTCTVLWEDRGGNSSPYPRSVCTRSGDKGGSAPAASRGFHQLRKLGLLHDSPDCHLAVQDLAIFGIVVGDRAIFAITECVDPFRGNTFGNESGAH